MNPHVGRLMERAGRNVAAARSLLEQGFFDIAVSRAYYAMFYASEAALLARGVAFSRHSGVIAAFNRELVRPGLLPRAAYEALHRAFDARNRVDYGENVVTRDAASRQIEAAEAFVAQIHDLLRRS